MGRKKIAMTLIELMTALVISTIIIAVSGGAIVTSLKLFYDTKSRTELDAELGVANMYLSAYIQGASYHEITGGGSILTLYSFAEPPAPRWVFTNTIDNGKPCLTLTVDGNITQSFKNVSAIFENPYPLDITRPTAVIVSFTNARFNNPVSAIHYCGRVPRTYSWAINLPTDTAIWNGFEPRGLRIEGNNCVVFGSTNDQRTDPTYGTLGRSGLLFFVNTNTGHMTNIFTYNWVRGSASNPDIRNVDFYTWNPGPVGTNYSYAGGMIEAGGTDTRPSLIVARLNIDPANPSVNPSQTEQLGAIQATKIFKSDELTDNKFANPLSARDRTFISDVKENAGGTLLLAGQINQEKAGVSVPHAFLIDNVSITATGVVDGLYNFGPNTGTPGPSSGIGWRFNNPNYTPKPPRLISLTGGKNLFMYNSSSGNQDDRGLGTSNQEMFKFANGSIANPEWRKNFGNGYQYWQDSIIGAGNTPVLTSQSIKSDDSTEIMRYTTSDTGSVARETYDLTGLVPGNSTYQGLTMNSAEPDRLTAITSFGSFNEAGTAIQVPFVSNFSRNTSVASSGGPIYGNPNYNLLGTVDLAIRPGNHLLAILKYRAGPNPGDPIRYVLINKDVAMADWSGFADYGYVPKNDPVVNNGNYYLQSYNIGGTANEDTVNIDDTYTSDPEQSTVTSDDEKTIVL